jgi:tRNA-dihydrouridine synthase B
MLRIGTLELDVPVVQAALSGYSDLPMRRIARRCGAPFAFNEVVLDQIVLARGKKRKRILNVAPDDHPVGGQLMGSQPDEFARAADAMVRAGYDLIDINFGCPVRKVLHRCRGGYLLAQPYVALEIVRRVHEAVAGRRPVTVKMRRGMDGSPEGERKFFEILDGALSLGAAAVTVHPRTVEQRYVGPAQWEFLRRVKQHVGNTVVLGSGDLFCAEDVARMIEQTGVDGVAIARGCIGNPWIFGDCRALLTGQPLPPPPGVAEQHDVIAEHYRHAIELYGEVRGSKIMRKFGIKYAEYHPCADEVRRAFVAVRSAADWQAVLDRWYDPAVAWPLFKRKVEPGDLIAAGAEE